MANLTGSERARYVQGMFTQIAGRYDLMNRIMTGGQDVAWRREAIHRCALQPGQRLLDLGAGTGDLAREALRQSPGVQVTAADFTLEMMRIGRQRHAARDPHGLNWSAADATRLPFPAESFDAVVSGFLLRNVNDLPLSLSEQYRVLRPGGRFVSLDTTPPPNNLLKPFIRIHLHYIIPALGRLIAGQADAYTYLPESTEGFLRPEQTAVRLQEAGFEQVGFAPRMFGTMAIHWGRKPG
ncbi:MAG: class I SAM-dependent methyltransferase [Chloroflexota bacterium]